MSDRDPLMMPAMFGRKFIVFSIVVLIVTSVAVYFFDNTKDEEIDLMNPYQHMEVETKPYRAINPEPAANIDSASTQDTLSAL